MNREIFDKQVYIKRQQQVFDQLPVKSLVVLYANQQQLISADNHYAFFQNNNFSYLCGFPEADSALVLIKTEAEQLVKLFVADKNPLKELWEGTIIGSEQAAITFSVDDALSIKQLNDSLLSYYNQFNIEHLYYDFLEENYVKHHISKLLNDIKSQLRLGVNVPLTLGNIGLILAKLRTVKDQVEVEVLQQAADIAAEAHILAMSNVTKCQYEYQLQGIIEGHFIQSGGNKSYNSIVGSGGNACILHYTQNNSHLKQGDLVLIDAGAVYRGYCSDITRTFPNNGTYSEAQTILYHIVLKAQLAAIDACVVGADYYAPHRAATEVLEQGLKQLDLINDNCGVRDLFPHGTGHWIGMDVHDIGPYSIDGKPVLLEQGMYLTIEPGLYLSDRFKHIPKSMQNIGIRIEDDILITEKGAQVLTNKVPKTIAEIENIING